jgi:hypothetical protein
MTVMPVRQVDVENRVLEATRELLDDRGFLVVVIDGESDNAVKAAWSLTASARFEASKRGIFRPIVLIAKNVRLLPPGKLNLLAQVGDLAIVAAPVVMGAARQKMASRRRLRIALILVAPLLASLALVVFLWPAAQRGALEMAATQLLTRIGIDAPGLRGRADPATPTARPAAAPSTETAAPFVPPLPSPRLPRQRSSRRQRSPTARPGCCSGLDLETLWSRSICASIAASHRPRSRVSQRSTRRAFVRATS